MSSKWELALLLNRVVKKRKSSEERKTMFREKKDPGESLKNGAYMCVYALKLEAHKYCPLEAFHNSCRMKGRIYI